MPSSSAMSANCVLLVMDGNIKDIKFSYKKIGYRES